MNRPSALALVAGIALCPFGVAFAAEAGPHWSYTGKTGPETWGTLDPASKTCSAGSQQSPVDVGTTTDATLPKLEIAWGKGADTIINNGHTIQVNFAAGSTLKVGNDQFKLLQLHFHRPSEHLINGKNFPMEVHFVHATADGKLGVIGAMMTTGKANPVFSKIISTMPMKEGPAVKADAAIDPNGLLPAKLGYYRYEGSLTTPPCSETVDWMLLTDPIEVSDADVAAFGKLYPMNARPAQKANRRFVLKGG